MAEDGGEGGGGSRGGSSTPSTKEAVKSLTAQSGGALDFLGEVDCGCSINFISWPYKLSQTPSSSKIDCCFEPANVVQKILTFPITNIIERQLNTHKCGRKKKTMGTSFGRYPPISTTKLCQNQVHCSLSKPMYATMNSPRGFGPPPRKTKKKKKSNTSYDDDDNDDDDAEEEEESEGGVIPEIVTNRMMSRMAVSVGAPLFMGLLFFPFFYYLKVGLKIDVPTWVPFIVSFFFFGTALLGVSYGIVSSSWDPMREGSFLGWNEAQKNWPVFWQSLWGRPGKK